MLRDDQAAAFRERIRESRDLRAITTALTTLAVDADGYEHADVVLFDPEAPAISATDLNMYCAGEHIVLRDDDGVLGILLLSGGGGGGGGGADVAGASFAGILPETVAALRVRQNKTRTHQQTEHDRLLRELRRRNEEMLDDLEQAREFQTQMLSRTPAIEGLTVQTVYRPHDGVSGDLHDIFIEGDRLRVLLADTTGHGVRAGLATMLLKAEYEGVKRAASDPSDVLTRLNARIMEAYRPGALTMTAICYDLDIRSGALRFAAAAHPCAVIVHEGAVRELPTGGSFIGVVAETTLVEGTESLSPGDTIVIYTDGVSEASATNGDLFGEERVHRAILLGVEDGTGARALVKAAEQFTRPLGFNDDVAIVSVRFRP